MRQLFAVLLLVAATATSQAGTLFKVTFDSATAGPWSSGTYTIGPGEITTNITGGAADPGIVPIPNGTNNPEFQNVSAITVGNTPVQGGIALVTTAGTTPDGAYIDFDPAFGLAPNAISVTLETVFLAKTLPVPGNTADISNIVSTEWPTANLNWNIRTIGTSLNFVVANADGEVNLTATGLVTNRWYHAVGVLTYNAGTPANSTLELFLDNVSKGTANINLSAGKFGYIFGNSHTTRGSLISLGVNAGNAEGYYPGDDRGLDGAISAVAVSDEARTPANFVLSTGAGVSDWTLFE